MLISSYALAVKIDDSSFEIFDILELEKNEERDLRYKSAISKGSQVINPKNTSGIKIGSVWNGDSFIPDNYDGCIKVIDEQNIYTFLSDNKIFGFITNYKNTFLDEKFQAAIDSEVILIDLEGYSNINLGDIWNGQNFQKAV